MLIVFLCGCGESSSGGENIEDGDGKVDILQSINMESDVKSIVVIDNGNLIITNDKKTDGEEIWINNDNNNSSGSFSISYDKYGTLGYIAFYPDDSNYEDFFIHYDTTGKYISYLSFQGKSIYFDKTGVSRVVAFRSSLYEWVSFNEECEDNDLFCFNVVNPTKELARGNVLVQVLSNIGDLYFDEKDTLQRALEYARDIWSDSKDQINNAIKNRDQNFQTLYTTPSILSISSANEFSYYIKNENEKDAYIDNPYRFIDPYTFTKTNIPNTPDVSSNNDYNQGELPINDTDNISSPNTSSNPDLACSTVSSQGLCAEYDFSNSGDLSIYDKPSKCPNKLSSCPVDSSYVGTCQLGDAAEVIGGSGKVESALYLYSPDFTADKGKSICEGLDGNPRWVVE